MNKEVALADASRHLHSDDSAGKAVARSDNITLRRRQAQLRYARARWLLTTGGNAPRRDGCAFAFAGNPDKVQIIRALNSLRCASYDALNPGAAAAPCLTTVPSSEIAGPS